MKMRLLSGIALGIALIGGAGGLQAQDAVRQDVLLIERLKNTGTVTKPKKGMTMAQVESRFGAPKDRRGAVGEPPISRWVYPEFTVYFEHSHVIHSVVNRASATETPGTVNG